MSSSVAPPGWHPDPSNPTGAFRWWDGTAWTAHTQPAPAPVTPAPVPTAPVAPVTYGSAYVADTSAAAPSAYAQTGNVPAQSYGNPYGTVPPPAQSYGNPYATTTASGGTHYPAGFGGPANLSFAKQNSLALIAMGVAALYILIAMTSHVVIMGVIPVMLSIRAFKRREQLAPVALVAAIIAVVVAFAALR
jgi:uncharacterized protein DUF2510